MKHAKLIFFGIIILLAIIGYSRYFLCDMPPPPNPQVIVDSWSKPLIDSGYKPAAFTKPDHITGDKLPETVEAVLYAEGTVDDGELIVSIVETPDDTVWLKATYNGEDVKFRKVEYSTQPKPTRNDNWSLILASEWIDSPDIGIGICYSPFEYRGARFGLQAVFDLNSDLTDSPDWITPAVRISRRFGAFSVGGYCGYRIGEQQGLGMGVSLGVAIGI